MRVLVISFVMITVIFPVQWAVASSAFCCVSASTAVDFGLFCNLTRLHFLLQNNSPKSAVGFWLVTMAKRQDLCQLITSKSWVKGEVGRQWTWNGLQSNDRPLPAHLIEDPLLLWLYRSRKLLLNLFLLEAIKFLLRLTPPWLAERNRNSNTLSSTKQPNCALLVKLGICWKSLL